MWRELVIVSFVVLGLTLATVPVSTSPDTKPDDCITAHSGAESDFADIKGVVTQPPDDSQVIRIQYNTERYTGSFQIMLPSAVKKVDKNGFSYNEEENLFEFEGGDFPYIEYKIGIEGENLQYTSKENWVFAPVPTHVGVGVTLNPRPAGVIGDHFLYIGNNTQYSTSIGCHAINLVIAEGSDLETSPTKILDTLEYTADYLDVGHKYDQVTIFLTPGSAKPPYPGFARDNEAWVKSNGIVGPEYRQLRTTLHEYIHTRQAFGGTTLAEMKWFHEGMADYYSFRVLVEEDQIPPSNYNQWLVNGSEMNAILNNPDSWDSELVQYNRGGAYLAVLDEKIKQRSSNSLMDVIKEINGNEFADFGVLVQQHEFIESVEKYSTNETAQWADDQLGSSEDFQTKIAHKDELGLISQLQTEVSTVIEDKPLLLVFVVFIYGILIGQLISHVKLGKNNRSNQNDDCSDK